MNITEETVRHVADLARLALSQDDVAKLVPQLDNILGYAEQLQDLDLADVAPTSHAFRIVNVLRADEPRPSLSRDLALQNAPDSDGEQVRVPAVLEG